MKETIQTQSQEWFRSWFDGNYDLVYSHRTDDEAEAFVTNWPLDWSLLTGSLALDVGCGNGRFCRALAKRGLKTVGVDLSRDQLRLAEVKRNEYSNIELIRAEMRHLPLKSSFDLVVSLFTSFGYFATDEENFRSLETMTNMLNPGGLVVIDLPCRENAIREVKAHPVTIRNIGGREITESRSLDRSGNRFEKEITITSNGNINRYHESARLFSIDEFLRMASAVGLRQIEPLWGDYTGKAVSNDLPRMVYFGRKGD